MTSFAYIAVDAEGREVRGAVDASDWPSAAAALAARGLRDCRPLASNLQRVPKLNSREALDLAGYIAQLAKSSLPLGGAMHAAARELPGGRLATALEALAERLDAGQTLEAAVESLSGQLPPQVTALVTGGVRSGRLGETLESLMADERIATDMTRQFWQAVSYPAALFAFLIGWLLFTTLWLIPEVEAGLRDAVRDDWLDVMTSQTERQLGDFARTVPMILAAAAIATVISIVSALVTGGRASLSRLFAHVPLVGTAWWYRGLTEFCGLLGTFLAQNLPLIDALRLTAAATHDPDIRRGCLMAAAEVERGSSLADSLAHQATFPPTLVRMAEWGEQNSVLGDILRGARETFRQRFELRSQTLRLVLPPIVFLLVAGSALFICAQMYAGMFRAIAMLSTFSPSPTQTTSIPAGLEPSGILSVMLIGASLLAAAYVLRVMAPRAMASGLTLRYTGYVLIAMSLLGVSVIALHGYGLIAWVVAMTIWTRAAIHLRAMQRRGLFSVLTMAVNHQMPLGPVVRAYADEQDGGFALRAHQFAEMLDQGDSLTAAIAVSPGVLPPEAELAAQVGRQSGDLRGALRATSYGSLFDRSILRSVVLRMLYLCPFWLVIVAFVHTKITPSLIKIFADFDTPLPEFTVLMISLAGGFLSATLALVAVLGTLGAFVLLVYGWLQWRGTLIARLPVLRRISNWVDMAPVLRSLALGTVHDRPLNEMLVAVANAHPKRAIRTRISNAIWQMDQGQSWTECLRRQRLISSTDVAILSAAERSGNLSWALREMADSFERRASYRLQAWAQVILPLAVLPMAIFVAAFAIAYMAPLAALIRNLS